MCPSNSKRAEALSLQEWLLTLSPTVSCTGDRFQWTDKIHFLACCQLHSVEDMLRHASEDAMSDKDRIVCVKALALLQDGNGVGANGPKFRTSDTTLEVGHSDEAKDGEA